MAFVLKEGLNYTDKQGYTHGNYYAIIEEIYINKSPGYISYKINMYKDVNCRLGQETPVESRNYNVNNVEDFNSVLAEMRTGKDIYKVIYELSRQDACWNNWVSDEQ